MWLEIGCLAFVLMALGDCNDWKWHSRILRVLFPSGLLLLFFSTICLIQINIHKLLSVTGFLFTCLFLFSLSMIIYTLFFLVPAKDAYITQEKQRPVCRKGFYSLCRHPGFWWFFLLYLSLFGAFGIPVTAALLFSGLNLLLIIFEDCLVFPASLAGYRIYKKETPFLIPNRNSIQTFIRKVRKHHAL